MSWEETLTKKASGNYHNTLESSEEVRLCEWQKLGTLSIKRHNTKNSKIFRFDFLLWGLFFILSWVSFLSLTFGKHTIWFLFLKNDTKHLKNISFCLFMGFQLLFNFAFLVSFFWRHFLGEIFNIGLTPFLVM